MQCQVNKNREYKWKFITSVLYGFIAIKCTEKQNASSGELECNILKWRIIKIEVAF